jgi:hypothetical protein
MGRRKRKGNHSPPLQNKGLQDLARNEENGYPDPDSTNKDKLYQGTK